MKIDKKIIIVVSIVAIVVIGIIVFLISKPKATLKKEDAIKLIKESYTSYQDFLKEYALNQLEYVKVDGKNDIYYLSSDGAIYSYYKIVDFDSLFYFATSSFKQQFVDGLFIIEQNGSYYQLTEPGIYYERKIESIKINSNKKEIIEGTIKTIYYDEENKKNISETIQITLKLNGIWQIDSLVTK